MSMPCFHVAGDVAYGPAIDNGSGEPMSKARATWCDGARKAKPKVRPYLVDRVYGIPAEPFDETSPKLGKDSPQLPESKTAAEEEVASGIAQGLDAVF